MTKLAKRLRRSETDKIIAGVCGGIGEYFNVDPVVIRLLYLVISVLTAVGPGVLCYIIAWIIIPKGVYWPSKVIRTSEPEKAGPVASAPVNDTPAV